MSKGQVTMTISGQDGRWLKLQADACRVKPADIVRRMIAAERAKPELSPYLLPVPELSGNFTPSN
jgi:hypothetical protein